MDWNNVAVILIWLWLSRCVLGVGYGFYLIHKKELHADWKADILCGPIFWIGWAIGTGIRRLVEWRRSRRTR